MCGTFTRKVGAFTLVELLTVIGIIGLIIAILLPTLAGAREASRVIQCAANLHEIDACWHAWGLAIVPGRRILELPSTAGWIDAAKGKLVEDRFLYCADGDQTRPASGAFALPSITHSKTSSGNGHPAPVFSPDPTTNSNATTYTATLKYQNAHADSAVIKFTQQSPTSWIATVISIDPGGGYGGPPINLAWGANSWTNVQVGQKFTNDSPAGGTNYGFNSQMSSQRHPLPGRLLAMDYKKTSIDFDNSDSVIDDATIYLVGRHNRKSSMNVLFTDGSVQLTRVKELDSSSNIYMPTGP